MSHKDGIVYILVCEDPHYEFTFYHLSAAVAEMEEQKQQYPNRKFSIIWKDVT